MLGLGGALSAAPWAQRSPRRACRHGLTLAHSAVDLRTALSEGGTHLTEPGQLRLVCVVYVLALRPLLRVGQPTFYPVRTSAHLCAWPLSPSSSNRPRTHLSAETAEVAEQQFVQFRLRRTWSSVLMFIEQNFGPHCDRSSSDRVSMIRAPNARWPRFWPAIIRPSITCSVLSLGSSHQLSKPMRKSVCL